MLLQGNVGSNTFTKSKLELRSREDLSSLFPIFTISCVAGMLSRAKIFVVAVMSVRRKSLPSQRLTHLRTVVALVPVHLAMALSDMPHSHNQMNLVRSSILVFLNVLRHLISEYKRKMCHEKSHGEYNFLLVYITCSV